jgi:hypothetical protein
MKYEPEKQKRRPARVAEPVQVYLDPADRERLERLAARLDTTLSDVLRQGLAALEAMTRRSRQPSAELAPLPTFRGKGLQPGVNLDDTSSLLDVMDGRASR